MKSSGFPRHGVCIVQSCLAFAICLQKAHLERKFVKMMAHHCMMAHVAAEPTVDPFSP